MFSRFVLVLLVLVGFGFALTRLFAGEVLQALLWGFGSFVFLNFQLSVNKREQLEDLDDTIEELEFEWQDLGDNEPRAARELLLKARELYRAHSKTAGSVRMRRLENLIFSCNDYLHKTVKKH